MRKNLNVVKICGKLYAFGDANGRQALELKTTGAGSKAPGTQYIGGIMQVAIDDAGLNVIPVHFTYVTATTSTGKTNNTFTVLKKLIEDGKTWLNVGPEAAAKVKIDAAIAINDFYNNEGNLISAKMIEGSFVSTNVDTCKPEDRNSFSVDMLITSVAHTDADPEANIPADFVTVHGAVFNFRGALLPVDFVVRNERGMAYFEDLNASTSNPIYTKVWGTVDCLTKKTEIREESAFGSDAVRTYERKVRDWVITGTSTTPYDFDTEETITAAELSKALQDREVYLADIKKRTDEYRNGGKSAAPATSSNKKFEF